VSHQAAAVDAGGIDAATLPVVLMLYEEKACVLLGREHHKWRVWSTA
jgi:hypothetical protein